MQNRAAHSSKMLESDIELSRRQFDRLVSNWILDGELSNRSPKTIKSRRDCLGKLAWLLDRRGAEVCGLEELRAFFLYLQRGHLEPGGRWGNPTETQQLRPLTLKTYYAYLRSFFNFCVAEGNLITSPMARIPSPRDPGDEVMPFTEEEVQALIKAAGRTNLSLRDKAIIIVLVDSGLRAQELCNLTAADVDFGQRSMMVREGKGKKSRQVYLGKKATKALWNYVQDEGRSGNDPLFISQRDGALTYFGLRQVFRRLGTMAKVKNCHAHRTRHTFAVEFLKAGGKELALMRLLGHTTIHMTNRYVQFAQADLQAQHRSFSPGDRIV